jgi:hypothetical protein
LDKRGEKMKKHKKPSKGQLNKIIDVLVHPYFEKYPLLILVDGAAHALIEQDAKTTIRKFVKYNAPAILKEFFKKPKKPE